MNPYRDSGEDALPVCFQTRRHDLLFITMSPLTEFLYLTTSFGVSLRTSSLYFVINRTSQAFESLGIRTSSWRTNCMCWGSPSHLI
jgi:hypothetical protein